LSNLNGAGLSSPRTAPDTYTPSLLGSLNGSVSDASIQTPYAQKANSADAMAAAVATAQKDADTAAQEAQQSPDLSKAAFSQLSRDMASLSALMQEDSGSQSASGAGQGTSADSIVITASSGAGSIAAIASDSANSSGSEATSSVAFVGADGQVTAASQGSVTASDGTTTAATLGYSASVSSDSSSQETAMSAYASVAVGTPSDTASAMQWVSVLVNSVSGTTTDGSQTGPSETMSTASVNNGAGSSSASYASLSAFIASGYQSGYSAGTWNSGQNGNVSVYA